MAKSDSNTKSDGKKKKKGVDGKQKVDGNTASDYMSSSDDSDPEVFDVENIVGHYIADDGQIMYEIKWKGYETWWENTYEPEGNLAGCELLLKRYKQKHNLSTRIATPSSSSLISTNSTNKSKQERRVTFDVKDDTATQKMPAPDIFSSDEDDEPIAHYINKFKGKEKAAENAQSRDKGKPKEKSKEASHKSGSSSYTVPKYSKLQTQQNPQNEPQHRQLTQSASTTMPPLAKSNIPQKPSLYIHKDHTPSNSSSSSSSFTNLKRSTISKTAQPVEIDRILSTFNGTFRHNLSATPKPLQITRPTSMPAPVYHSSSSNTSPPTTPTSQTAIRTNPRMTDLTAHRQPPPPPPPPPPPQQQQPQQSQPSQPLQQSQPQPHQRPTPPLPPHQPFHQQLSTSLPIKRQTSRPDPRLIANERKKLKLSNNEPCQLEVTLKKGNDQVCRVTLSGAAGKVPQLGRIKHLLKLQNPQGKEITINTFLPLKRLSDYLPAERTLSFMSVAPTDQFIQAGKLRNFMSVNEITGIVCHPDMPTEALFIMAAKDVSKVSNLPADTGFQHARLDQLFAIFVDNLPPRPRVNFQDVDYVDDSDQLFTWRQMCRYLKFPAQLQHLYQTTSFLVYGHSESSVMLNKACMSLPPVTRKPTNPLVPHNIMMFDRFNNELQHKNLLKHKREPVTQIWEFGVPNFYYGDIEPACEVFPQHSGGFITTDAVNMVNNPHIIESICSQIKKFNDIPVAFGEWKFVLPHNFLQSFKQLLKDGHDSVAVQEALIYLTIALSNGDIEIMRTWPEEKQEPNCIVFIKHVLREYYRKKQYFVYVDDVDAVSAHSKETHVSIDFVTTDTIFKTFA